MPDYLEIPHTNNVRAGVVRVMGVAFVVNADFQSDVGYNVRGEAIGSIGIGEQHVTIGLYIESDVNPSVLVDTYTVETQPSGILGLLSTRVKTQGTLRGRVPAGWHVKIDVIDGTGTAELLPSSEVIYANASQP